MIAGWKRSQALATLIATLLAGACADAPTEPDKPVREPTFTRNFYYGEEQLEVVTRHYAIQSATVTRTIGRGGGYISVQGVMLVVPSGALDRNVDITLTVSAGDKLGVELEPHGLTFRRPAYVGFLLSGTDYSATNAETELTGAYHTDGLAAGVVTPREVMPVYMLNGLAAFGVWHFSDYSITKKKGLILVGG